MKTLKNIKRHEKVRFAIPRSVQDIIPVKTVWQDGIFYADGNIQRPLSLRILITALREKRIRRPCSLNTASFLILLTAQR